MKATVTTKYVPATGATGSRILVTERGTRRQKRFPYDYAARDVHEWAALRFAREALGMGNPVAEYANGRQPSRGFRFTLTDSV